jgi:phage/plasmid-associated DNA primase
MATAAQRLQRFLDARKVGPGQAATHTSMAGGSYYVMGCDNDALFEAYVAAALQQHPRCSLSLTERPRHIGPVRIDLDFRPTTVHSVATPESTVIFVRGMFVQLGRLVLIPADVAAYVLTKPPRVTGKGTRVIKDGVHIIVPDVVTRPEVQHLLRHSMLPLVAELFGGSCTNGAEDIYDAAVIDKSGWLMYGSKKTDETAAWTLGCVLTPEGVDITDDVTVGDTAHLVPLMSIRNKHTECECSDEGRRLLDAMLAAQEAKRVAVASTASSGSHTVGVNMGELARTVALLSPERAREYGTWMKVAFGIINTSGGSEEGRALLHRFSASCREKYADDEVDAWWNVNRRSSRKSDGVGMGSMCMWAKEDSPEAYSEAYRAAPHRDRAAPHQVAQQQQQQQQQQQPASGNVMPSLVTALRASCPQLFCGLPDDTVFDPTNGGLNFALPPACFTILKSTHRILQIGTAEGGGTDIGPLLATYPLGKQSLAFLDKNLLPAEPLHVQCTEMSTEQTDLTSTTLPGSLVSAFHDGNYKFVSAKVKEGRKESVHTAAPKMTALSTLIGGARKAALERQLGPDVVAMFDRCNVLNNNGTIVNVNVHLDPDANSHTDEQLVNAVIAANPELLVRHRFAPDAKVGNCNGLYVCDAVTNVWSQRHNAAIEATLVKMFGEMDDCLTPADRKHVEGRRGRNDMLYILSGKVIDDRFLDRLDADLDLFAVDNGTFDMRVPGGGFRPIAPNDWVGTTAGWAYSKEAAMAHRAKVEAFLSQVLPVEEERDAVLAYFAGLLSGRRLVRKFMVFTDRRAGANGKSTLAQLMCSFFGAYAKTSTKFVCRGAFERDRDSHGAGTEPYRGKRLVVAEELKHTMTLDVAMIKKLTGGASARVEDRRIGVGEWFKFTWQAGFLLIFNEGDCPAFDAGDAAFLERMIVAPMRAKFVSSVPDEAEAAHTFALDPNISAKFADWMPAMMDVLLERFAAGVAPVVPPSMRTWRSDISSDNNPVATWVDNVIEVTGNREDYVLMADLKAAFTSTSGIRIPKQKVSETLKAYFNGLQGVAVKDGDAIKVDGVWKSVRGVVRGVVRRAAQA